MGNTSNDATTPCAVFNTGAGNAKSGGRKTATDSGLSVIELADGSTLSAGCSEAKQQFEVQGEAVTARTRARERK